jgi:hypothetical protein
VPVGGVEGSKLCLFSVIMPAKCVSSISPRFHYRRLAFCFLPLASIMESSMWPFLKLSTNFKFSWNYQLSLQSWNKPFQNVKNLNLFLICF